MRKSIIMYCDDDKDKDLLEWLNSKNGRSSYMRNILYRIMKEEKGIIIMTTPQAPMIEQKEEPKISNSFMKSLNGFIKK